MTIEFEYNGYEITALVEECRDGYGTGDSPTLYDVTLLGVVNEDGIPIFESDMSRRFYDNVIDAAIEAYKGD